MAYPSPVISLPVRNYSIMFSSTIVEKSLLKSIKENKIDICVEKPLFVMTAQESKVFTMKFLNC